jgi:hypothetical protein
VQDDDESAGTSLDDEAEGACGRTADDGEAGKRRTALLKVRKSEIDESS